MKQLTTTRIFCTSENTTFFQWNFWADFPVPWPSRPSLESIESRFRDLQDMELKCAAEVCWSFGKIDTVRILNRSARAIFGSELDLHENLPSNLFSTAVCFWRGWNLFEIIQLFPGVQGIGEWLLKPPRHPCFPEFLNREGQQVTWPSPLCCLLDVLLNRGFMTSTFSDLC